MSAHLPLAIRSACSNFVEQALRKRNPLHRTRSAACDEWAYSPVAESSARREERSVSARGSDARNLGGAYRTLCERSWASGEAASGNGGCSASERCER